MLHINYIRSLSELHAIKPAWDKLFSNSKCATIFQSWDWNYEWCKQVLPTYKSANLKIITLENKSDNIIAIIPVFEDSIAGPAARILQFLGHHISCLNDILISEPENKELIEEIIYTLKKNIGFRTFLFLKHLDGDSCFTKVLAEKNMAEVQYQRLTINHDPEIKDQRLRLRKATRKNFRWRENKLKRDHEIRYSIKSGEEAAPAFKELVKLHQTRFKSTNRETFVTESVVKFFHNCLLAMPNQVELIELYANDKVIASELAIQDNGQYFFMVGGFDHDFQEFSPLRILMTECMRRAFDDLNCQLCDLGPGYEVYKYDWNPDTRSNYLAPIAGSGPYARLISSIYRKVFKHYLPLDPRDSSQNDKNNSLKS